jgi:hypothetical protein
MVAMALTPVLLLKIVLQGIAFVLQGNVCASKDPGAQARFADQMHAGLRMGVVPVVSGMLAVQTKRNASRVRSKDYVPRMRKVFIINADRIRAGLQMGVALVLRGKPVMPRSCVVSHRRLAGLIIAVRTIAEKLVR